MKHKKRPKWIIHVVANTHWDREFRDTFQKTRINLVKMIDELITLLENNPDYASYTMDAHVLLLEDYLEIRPENRKRIEKLVKTGRLFIGPWYSLPDIPNIGQEAIVRNLLRGHQVAKTLGGAMNVGYTPCSWGQTGQLPQIYAGFGINYICFYRGISLHESDAEFIWVAPDGTEALTSRFARMARYNWYYLVHRKITCGHKVREREWEYGKKEDIPFRMCGEKDQFTNLELQEPPLEYDKMLLGEVIQEMLAQEGGDFTTPHFLAMNGHDISYPFPLDPEIIDFANNLFPDILIRQSNLEEYFEALARDVKPEKLKRLYGERRCNLKEGYSTYLIPSTISARTRLKLANFITENLLTAYVEPISVLTNVLGNPYPTSYLDLAWQYLLRNHTHDANAGCAPDKVSDDVLYRYRQSQEISEGITTEAIKYLARRVKSHKLPSDAIQVLVYNPLPVTRTETVELLLDVPQDKNPQSLLILSAEGELCDYQPLNAFPAACFVDNKWNVPENFNSKRMQIKLNTGNLPPLGYQVYTVETVSSPNRHTGSLSPEINCLENEYLKVIINNNGTFNLLHKETETWYKNLGYFIDQGEVGSAWKHLAPPEDKILNSLASKAQIALIQDGKLSSTYKIDIKMEVPEGTVNDRKRSDKEVLLPISIRVTLNKDSKRLDLTVEFDNSAYNHWLRMAFPTNIETDCSYADSHFDVVKRTIPLPERDTWQEEVYGTYPYRTFVDLTDGDKGLAVLSEGLQEFEVFDYPSRPILISLLRAVQIKLEVTDERKQLLPDPGPQCLGRHCFRLALYPHKGDWAKGKVINQAQKFTAPVKVAQIGKTNGDLPRHYGFMELNGDNVFLSALKKAENKEQYIVRLWNPSAEDSKATLTFALPVKKVYRLNLKEDVLEKIDHKLKSEINIDIPGKKIISLGVEF